MLRLIFLCILCFISAGPVNCWSTLEPMLIQRRVFFGEDQREQLDHIYAISNGAGIGGSLFFGMFFDRYGGASSVFWGAVVTGVGLMLMALSVSFPGWNWLLYAAYPITNIGGSMNVYGIYSFLWHFPEHPNLVASLADAVTALSEVIVVTAVFLHRQYEMPLETFLMALGILCLSTSFLAFHIVPSMEEVKSCAREAVQEGRVTSESAIAEVESMGEDNDEVEIFRQCIDVFQKNIKTNLIFLNYIFLVNFLLSYVLIQQFYYYEQLFGARRATWLVDIFAINFGVSGFLFAVFGGYVCDEIGIERFLSWMQLMILAFSLLLFCPYESCQILSQAQLSLLYDFWDVLVMRIAMLYAPPHLLGTFSGLLYTVAGVSQMILEPAYDMLSSAFLPQPLPRYWISFAMFTLYAILAGETITRYWKKNSPPTPPLSSSSLPLSLDVEGQGKIIQPSKSNLP
ncbi:hypothetical protein GUITHDRAFT_145099 [Guillardia theta CCMP2712]|uniref:Major facilitator superfamily (MFS) profile domain-containing protein n=1 Tax=Guillardia theta (strain CCMP2712) TaxID=905079 RepID=L1IMD6_GUITC|nr:hypothetical protein GUITHDRAFT_145099 [Guillardia theta CCMP2712]EKX37257.1 hypothetical protein GUITHDRAFT_145099 [Guillardia theta CCMP2712]|eukprot:XP_005824237.1 hypothetical protein GUITHDRAFT_145099 [Guillardia theta CCMP2712]